MVKRTSSTMRRERQGVMDLIDHLITRRASLDKSITHTKGKKEVDFLRARKRGVDTELSHAHGRVAALDRSLATTRRRKTQNARRGGRRTRRNIKRK